jgi:prephenate dehydrogenase
MSTASSVGIIGLGSFGTFVASLLAKHGNVRLYGFDTQTEHTPAGVERADFATVAQADVLLLAIPLDSYPDVLEKLKTQIRPETLVVDICSVKVYPTDFLRTHLPNHPNLLVTHPLFGPQTAANGLKGHRLIVTESRGALAKHIVDFCEHNLQLEVHHMSAEEHDKAMAHIHALTFFLARGLANLQLKDETLITPSYRMITDLVRFDHTHTDDLFRTIQLGNPFAKQVRQQVVQSFASLDASLGKEPGGQVV